MDLNSHSTKGIGMYDQHPFCEIRGPSTSSVLSDSVSGEVAPESGDLFSDIWKLISALLSLCVCILKSQWMPQTLHN